MNVCVVCIRAAPRIVSTISIRGTHVSGVTSVDDELFALLIRDDNQVAVYSTSDYQPLRRLNVPDYMPTDNSDIASCVLYKCLYLSERDDRCVHRYELASGTVSKWPVGGRPYGLSVTASGNLLVACHSPNQLVELSAEGGEQVREIALESDIAGLWHGLQLPGGQFVVCHGRNPDDLNRACLVDDGGKVTRSYGGPKGSGDGHLNNPTHLAIDNDSQSVFVADGFNQRIAVLSSTLDFVRYVGEGLSRPCRLHLDQTTRCLYVGQFAGYVTVIQL